MLIREELTATVNLMSSAIDENAVNSSTHMI
jgi:hypothetical protein